MGNIYNHLDMIKVRPGMYIGDNNISSLKHYIYGYYGCLFEKGIKENEKPNFHDFHDWIANKYGYSESTSGWCNMILEQTNKDEKVALKLFFELLEEFKKLHK